MDFDKGLLNFRQDWLLFVDIFGETHNPKAAEDVADWKCEKRAYQTTLGDDNNAG